MKSLMICLVGLLVPVHASPVSPPMVAGHVRLADGSPVAGAQVVLFDVADLTKGPVGQATTDEAGQFALPLAASGALVLPQGFALGPNYPNPFNPSTIIPYQLASPAPVRLEVFNILGTEQQDATVARLLDEVPVLVSGVFEIDGRDYLYLGIDRDYYTQYGGEPLYATLKERFPITPLIVEASDGVQTQADRRARAEPASPNQEETRPVGSGAGKVSSSDRDVLVALFEATAGNHWTNNTHWLSDKPLADWFGVTTDENGRVTRLDLRVNGLRGSLPPALGQLHNLTYLNLRGNPLSGSLPSALGQLHNLTHLYLYDNQLSGSIPTALGQLHNLELLNLRGNPLSGSLPASLVNLTDLQWLVVEDTPLCAPTDAGFQAWLKGIENKRGVVNCTGDSAGATPEQPPNLTIPSVTASPTHPESEGLITMQITVHNRGAGAASSEIIRVYRHAAPTANPIVNSARIVQTARSGSLAAGASATRSLSTVVPSVTSATTYYYYACVTAADGETATEDNCSGPAEVRVQAPVVAQGIPEFMGGDALFSTLRLKKDTPQSVGEREQPLPSAVLRQSTAREAL